MRWILFMVLFSVTGGCATLDTEEPTLADLAQTQLPANEWVVVTAGEREFMALRQAGAMARDVLWTIIDAQNRTLAIGCRDQDVDAIAEVCEQLISRQPLRPDLADVLYRQALEYLLGLTPEPIIPAGTKYTPASLPL